MDRSLDKELLLTADELKNKQSVRATFRISQQAIALLNLCASLLGIKQKSLFDQLVDNRSILKLVAERAQEKQMTTLKQRQQKTFVLSRNSLINLNRIARAENISRDILVEMSIHRLIPIITQEKEQHQKRKQLLSLLADYYQYGQKLLMQAERLLGTEDTYYELLANQIQMQQKTIQSFEDIVERGEIMENQASSI